MESFLNKKSVKSKFLKRIKEHQEADHLIQGYGYWNNGKGCAVGCTLHVNGSAHAQYPIQLGLPEWLAHLEDHLFENLPVEDARKWPFEFLDSIPVGVSELEFSQVRDRFQIFWLERQKTQIDCAKFEQVIAAIDGVIALLHAALEGIEPESAAWSAAESAAESAAWSAAESAAESAAWSAAQKESLVKRDWLLAELKAVGNK